MANYLLTDGYAIDKDKYNVAFKTNIASGELTCIIANIQFLTDEIKHAAELSAIEIVSVLKMFYDNTILLINDDSNVDYIIDEYVNWEYYCGSAEEILNHPQYQREGLEEFIVKLLENQEMLNAIG